MRIIAGKWRGRPLTHFKADHIRPTTDRVKEVIFNMLQFEVENAHVLDLFAGTGNLAFEALSRGAARVVAVEMSRQSKAIIEKNRQLLQVGPELTITQLDVFKFLKKNQEKFQIILVDPPFTQQLADQVMGALAVSETLTDDGVIFIESSKQEKIADCYGRLQLKSRKNFGDKLLSQFVVAKLAIDPD